MQCPKCNGKTKVIDTRHRQYNEIMRRRKCLICDHRITTWETSKPTPQNLRLRQQGWLEIKRLPFMGKVG
ncbi:MAG: hypothetical protein ACR2PS_00225 [Pseudomonadales bacterium]